MSSTKNTASTPFRKEVYAIAQEIPRGKVATYGQLARLAGRPKASRAVGMFMRTNPNAPTIPCHRVVAHDGSLHGFSAGNGLSTKRVMLEEEGVIFKGDKVNLQESLWDSNLIL